MLGRTILGRTVPYNYRVVLPSVPLEESDQKNWEARLTGCTQLNAWISRPQQTQCVMSVPLWDVAPVVYHCMEIDPHLGGPGADLSQKFEYIIQGLGRYSDLANRFEGLMFSGEKSLFGRIKAPMSWGWLVWRGSKLSQSQLTKYALSLDAGNILKVIAMYRSVG